MRAASSTTHMNYTIYDICVSQPKDQYSLVSAIYKHITHKLEHIYLHSRICNKLQLSALTNHSNIHLSYLRQPTSSSYASICLSFGDVLSFRIYINDFRVLTTSHAPTPDMLSINNTNQCNSLCPFSLYILTPKKFTNVSIFFRFFFFFIYL